jgi:hypothetical protein
MLAQLSMAMALRLA